MSEELTDAQLVELLRTDRVAGFDLLYRRYAERLFAYSVTVMRDRAAAEDATHESLMAAVAKIDQLRNPAQLRPWLFAITRNRCLSVATESNRFTSAEEVLDMIPVDEDASAGLAQQDSAGLVSEALAGLAPVDRDTLALALRHDLDMADVALAMGANQATARARISRAKAALTGSVTGLLLARAATGDDACAGLTESLAGFTGEWTPLIRKRVAKHAKSCAQCNERGHQRAVQYVSAFTVPVALILAPQARARADEGLATLDADGAGEWLTWRSDGFPVAVGDQGSRWGRGLLVAGAAGIALLLTGLVAWQVNAGTAPPQPSPSVSPSVSPTPSPTETPSPRPSPSPTQSKQQQQKNQEQKPDKQQPTPAATTPTPTPEEPTPEPTKSPRDKPTKEPKPDPEPRPTKEPRPDPAPEPKPEPEPEPEREPEPEPEPTKPTEPEPTKPTEPEPRPTKPTTPDDVNQGSDTLAPDDGPVIK